jgi:SARP family transcriptional regulator, regulator of embCAB operon
MAALSSTRHGPSLRAENGCRYPLVAITRIGRSADNDIVLSGNKVSRHHAAIVDTGSSFVIVDLQSVNGVYVSGQQVHTSVVLTEGDQIRIDNHKLVFESISGETVADE